MLERLTWPPEEAARSHRHRLVGHRRQAARPSGLAPARGLPRQGAGVPDPVRHHGAGGTEEGPLPRFRAAGEGGGVPRKQGPLLRRPEVHDRAGGGAARRRGPGLPPDARRGRLLRRQGGDPGRQGPGGAGIHLVRGAAARPGTFPGTNRCATPWKSPSSQASTSPTSSTATPRWWPWARSTPSSRRSTWGESPRCSSSPSSPTPSEPPCTYRRTATCGGSPRSTSTAPSRTGPLLEVHPPFETHTNPAIRNPLRMSRGYVEMPEAPGLGVDLDWDAIEDMTVEVIE